jgi:hypothetical protein
MSLAVNIREDAPATADAPRLRARTWTAGVILLALAGCVIAMLSYFDAPVIDGSLVGLP